MLAPVPGAKNRLLTTLVLDTFESKAADNAIGAR
jgi:hypothetical protein